MPPATTATASCWPLSPHDWCPTSSTSLATRGEVWRRIETGEDASPGECGQTFSTGLLPSGRTYAHTLRGFEAHHGELVVQARLQFVVPGNREIPLRLD